MKAWEVLAVAHGGELVCWDCMTPEERRCANDRVGPDDDPEIAPLFASDAECNEVCGRCLKVIEGTECDGEGGMV